LKGNGIIKLLEMSNDQQCLQKRLDLEHEQKIKFEFDELKYKNYCLVVSKTHGSSNLQVELQVNL